MKREELVEAAAKAIFFRGGEQDGAQWLHTQPRHRELALEQAQAALTAILEGLREPSEEMLAAGGKAFIWPSEARGGKNPAQSAAASFVAMLSTLDDRSTHVGGEG